MMLWGNNRCVLLRIIHCGATFKCMLIAKRVLLQTSRHLRRRKALVKAAPCRDGERPCASFGPSTGQGESTAFPTNPQFTAGIARSNTQHV